MDSLNIPEIECVRVFIRIRPLNEKEIAEGNTNIFSIGSDKKAITFLKSIDNNRPKNFTFDHIFCECSSQWDLYHHAALPIVEKTLKGYNGTIFAYGQSGTGKTHTMMGCYDKPDLKGIIPNTFSHILSQISKADSENEFVVSVAYLEIYNEDVRDLLAPDPCAKLEVRECKENGVYVKNLSEHMVDSLESVNCLINRGNKNRITRTTMLNAVSSRSHAIFIITIEARNKINNKTTVSRLNLVDLAGSERLKRTQATGDRLREASNINQSLSVLGNVISALTDGTSTHIPYRNSKLTRLLQDSLGGNTKTTMIAMISPTEIDYEESICTLRYASRVKFIKNQVQINVKTHNSIIESFEEEIAQLKQRLEEINALEAIEIQQKASRKKKEHIEYDDNDDELVKMEMEKNEVQSKIIEMQNKILVGGQNLIELAEEQYFLMESSEQELCNLVQRQEDMEKDLHDRGLERINIEEQYSSLQEEDKALNEKLQLVLSMLNEVKDEYADKEHEYQREMEHYIYDNKLLMKELQLQNLILKNYFPKKELHKILRNTEFDVDIMDYKINYIAQTGNNVKRKEAEEENEKIVHTIKPEYLSYRKIYKIDEEPFKYTRFTKN